MVDGIIYGEDPRQGYVEGNTFYHPELKFKFSFPSGWRIQNQPAQVNMAPEDGKALMVFTLSSQKTLAEAAQTTLKELELTQQESRNVTVNGMPAIATLSQQVVQDESTGTRQTNEVLSYFINCDNKFYVFHGLAAEADFNSLKSTFEKTMVNFSRLTDASKLNVKPKKLMVKKVQSAGTVADVLASFGVKQSQMKDMALLNNLELTDKVSAGRLIKIVGQ